MTEQRYEYRIICDTFQDIHALYEIISEIKKLQPYSTTSKPHGIVYVFSSNSFDAIAQLRDEWAKYKGEE